MFERSSAVAHLRLHNFSLADYEAKYGTPEAITEEETNTAQSGSASTLSPVYPARGSSGSHHIREETRASSSAGYNTQTCQDTPSHKLQPSVVTQPLASQRISKKGETETGNQSFQELGLYSSSVWTGPPPFRHPVGQLLPRSMQNNVIGKH